MKQLLLLPVALFALSVLPSCSSSLSTPLPSLSNPTLARQWGAPKKTTTQDGYRLVYQNPDNGSQKLTVIASRRPMARFDFPPYIKSFDKSRPSELQNWGYINLAGKSVRSFQSYFAGKNHGAVFNTVGAPLTSPSGQEGFFRASVEGTKNQMQTWVSGLRFAE